MSHRGDGNNNNIDWQRQRQSQHHAQGNDSGENSQHVHHNNRRESNNNKDPMQVDYRVLRCFCGCSQLNFEQIEQFCMMSLSGVITHPLAKSLFRTFLRIDHRTDKSNALLSLECFELCDKIITSNTISSMTINVDDIDALMELCPSFDWEEKINDAIESDKQQVCDKCNLTKILQELKQECVRNIECHNDFDRFRRELLRKIGK